MIFVYISVKIKRSNKYHVGCELKDKLEAKAFTTL